MGQIEVYNFLKNKRAYSDDWFSASEIKEGLKEIGEDYGNRIYNMLYKLSVFGFIEAKGQGLWKHKKVFRAKKS